MCCRLRFKRSYHNAFIKRIAWNNLKERDISLVFKKYNVICVYSNICDEKIPFLHGNDPFNMAALCTHNVFTYLPMMEYRQTESLALSMGPKISFKTERINSWYKCFDSVQWRARNWRVLSHVAPMMKRMRPNLRKQYAKKKKEQGLRWKLTFVVLIRCIQKKHNLRELEPPRNDTVPSNEELPARKTY